MLHRLAQLAKATRYIYQTISTSIIISAIVIELVARSRKKIK